MHHVIAHLSSRVACVAALTVAFAAVGCAATPASRTVANSDTTTQTAAGGETRTVVSQTSVQGANGANTTERTETVRTTTPAPTPPRP